MQVRVLIFGTLKELLGRSDEVVVLPDGATLADLVARYESRFPRLRQYTGSLAFSVNREYASIDVRLHDQDEVGLLPPVSGGSGARGGKHPMARRQARPRQRNPKPAVEAGKGSAPAAGARRPAMAAHVSIVDHPIETGAVLAEIKQPEDGAIAVFEGIVRDHSRGRRTLYLDYEAYRPMALGEMESLAEEALGRFAVREVALVHRLGRLEIGETSVLVAVAAGHRGAAFDACRWLIDTLKKLVPIWKKEYFEDGAVWADGEPFPEETRNPGQTLGGPAASKRIPSR